MTAGAIFATGSGVVRQLVTTVLRVLGVGAMFAFFGVGAGLLSWVILPVARLSARDELGKRRVCQRLLRSGFRLFHRAMGALRLVQFDARTVPAALPGGACVIVANHPTLIDVTALLAVFPDACTVVRSDLFHLPIFGPLLRYSGSIDAGDGASMAGAAVIQTALDRLREGTHVVIFPEGTRSTPGSLHRFHRGAFEVALRAGVPVVPMFISCDPPTLMKGVPWYANARRLSRMRIEPLDPIAPDAFAGDSRRFSQHVRSLLLSRQVRPTAEPLDVPPPFAPSPFVTGDRLE